MTPHPADLLAFDRAVVTRPVWNRFVTGAEAFGLPQSTLLHAGPPFSEPAAICRPILNSSCVAAVYEGLASDFDTAQEAILAGGITLAPAQDYGVVTPLAAVVSASMPLHAVYDAHRGAVCVYAPINGGAAPALRLGLREQAVLDHIRWLNGPLQEVLAAGLGEGIDLIELAVIGLAAGDDCHGRTPAATAALIAELEARTPGGVKNETAAEFLNRSPSMFLNLWMAATKCIMTAASGIDGSGFVTAAGGNGVEVGIQLSGAPGRWVTAKASPPIGTLESDFPLERALPAIGDSAVVDAFGLGAMAFHLSPAQMEGLGAFLPPDMDARRHHVTLGRHPDFGAFDLRLGASARTAAETGLTPVISLGIVDALGDAGRLGGGIYEMPRGLFEQALDLLSA